MAEPNPAQYDPFAAEYAEHAATAPYNALYDRPAMLDLIGNVAGRTILDAGCGPGLYLQALVGAGARVIGCDASAAMIALARDRLGDDADLRVHDLQQPFGWLEDASINVVLNALTLHYLTDRLAFLSEMHRVLVPDGALVISTHHPTNDWRRLGGSYFAEEPVTETWTKGWEITAWRMPLTKITADFAAAGFVIEQLVEPRPVDAMAVSDPARYQLLTTQPAFIMFRLLKR